MGNIRRENRKKTTVSYNLYLQIYFFQKYSATSWAPSHVSPWETQESLELLEKWNAKMLNNFYAFHANCTAPTTQFIMKQQDIEFLQLKIEKQERRLQTILLRCQHQTILIEQQKLWIARERKKQGF